MTNRSPPHVELWFDPETGPSRPRWCVTLRDGASAQSNPVWRDDYVVARAFATREARSRKWPVHERRTDGYVVIHEASDE